jgi:hypothetical protein
MAVCRVTDIRADERLGDETRDTVDETISALATTTPAASRLKPPAKIARRCSTTRSGSESSS